MGRKKRLIAKRINKGIKKSVFIKSNKSYLFSIEWLNLISAAASPIITRCEEICTPKRDEKGVRSPTHNPFVALAVRRCKASLQERMEEFSCTKQLPKMCLHPLCSLAGIYKEIVIKMIMKNHLLTICDYNRWLWRDMVEWGAKKNSSWFIIPSNELPLFCWCLLSWFAIKWAMPRHYGVMKWISLFTQIGLVYRHTKANRQIEFIVP